MDRAANGRDYGKWGDYHENDTTDYKSLSGVNVYEFMDHAYQGTGGFRTGNYLVPHIRERFWTRRRDLAMYKNFLKSIIRAMVEPVFGEEITRTLLRGGNEVSDGTVVDFVGNVDNRGTDMQAFAQRAVRKSRLHGGVFVVMDNFDELPEQAEEARRLRKYPYVYLRTFQQLKSYDVDDFGNVTAYVFDDVPEEVQKQYKGKDAQQAIYRRWTVETVDLVRYNSETKRWEVLETKPQPLADRGVLPIFSLYAVDREDNSCPLVEPPLYDIARMCHTIFNKDSEIRELERSQGFAIFYHQSGESKAGATWGPHNAWRVPMEAKMPPGFAAPPADTLKIHMENREKLREELYMIAEQQGVTGVTDSKSGVAKQWDFFAHESVLQQTAVMATVCEEGIIRLFGLYAGEEYEVLPEYPRDFQPNDKAAELGLYETYTMLPGIPAEGTALAAKKATRLVFADEEPEDVQAVIDAIDRGEVDRQQSNADASGGGEE